MAYLYIMLGAIAGAPLRYFVQGRVQDLAPPAFPYGTLVVNITGCLLIGLLLTLAEERDMLGRESRLLLVTGFLGGYTTFSTFGWETYALLRDNEVLQASGNVILSVAGGIFGVWAGSMIARLP
ncbi:MAG: fluoride efflux transporter CrcB [Chloroflexi bacterium]|nr:fluoride efflux transporter CrcB [Chloroflexota bacterium]